MPACCGRATRPRGRRFHRRYRGPLSDAERSFLDAIATLESSPTRRRSAAIVGRFAALPAVAVAMLVLLAIVQRSRTDVRHAVKQTRIAMRQVEHSYQELLQRERVRERIEAQKSRVDLALSVSTEELAVTNQMLQRERDGALEAARAAQRAQRSAGPRRASGSRSRRRKPHSSPRRPRRRPTGSSWAYLRMEQARAKELQAMIGSAAITTLKTFDSGAVRRDKESWPVKAVRVRPAGRDPSTQEPPIETPADRGPADQETVDRTPEGPAREDRP
jgi:hypothetical protein